MSVWPTAALAEIAEISRASIQAGDIESGTKYIGLENISSGGRSVEAQTVNAGDIASNKFVFGRKHILFGKLRPYLAKIAIPGFEGVCSTDILPILPGERVDGRYLLHFLRDPSVVELANARSSGANLPRLSPSELKKFQIPLPPVDEQQRIAAILDHADTLRAKRREAIACLDELTQSIFVDTFGADWVEFPKHPLGEIALVDSGITKGRRTTAETREVPYMAVSNVQDKRLDLSVVKNINATDAEIDRLRLTSGDLLLTEGGDPDKLGRGTVWNNELPECIFQNHIFRVRAVGGSVDPIYLSWVVGSRYGKSYFLRSAKQTTGIATINKSQLRSFPVPIAPLALQTEFLAVLAKIEDVRTGYARAVEGADSLFESIQARAFRGEL